MQRIAFTIIYNGLHHLLHNGFSEFMLENFDKWVVIEGHARPGGSTRWCRGLQVPPQSTDGTHQYLTALAEKNPSLIYYSPNRYWKSKDQQVNEAIRSIQLASPECFLWQVDCDEQWTLGQLKQAESELTGIAGAFQFNHFLCRTNDGRQLIAKGEWGSGWNTRLWRWKGERFLHHEPPVIEGQTTVQELTPVYDHYSYSFEADVKFKSIYYRGYEAIHRNWKRLREFSGEFPQPISLLMGNSHRINRNKSTIEIYEK